MQNEVIAILCADIHLSHTPPVWRSAEPDWCAAMQRPLDEIAELQKKYKCTVLCAGDIYDKWNSPAELINFAMDNLSRLNMYSIPGQHDLPNHNISELEKSAYETLSKADAILDVAYSDRCPSIINSRCTLSAFPFSTEIKPLPEVYDKKNVVNIALVHQYVCTYKSDYPGAPKKSHVKYIKANTKLINGKLYGYDVIVFGDNHKGFHTCVGKTIIWNCGTLMRRKSDEIDYKPKVGLLFSNGVVEPYYLDQSQDKYLSPEQTKKLMELSAADFKKFAKELSELGDSELDFQETWKFYVLKNNVSKEIDDIVWNAMTKESK